MKGTKIVVESPPRGKFDEGFASGTIYPGTCVELVPGTAAKGGRFTYRNVSRADGAKGPVCIVRSDELQGFTASTAITDGGRLLLYWPQAGDELNMLLRQSAGTGSANEVAIGDKLSIEKGTGELIAAGSLASAPFELLENTSGDPSHTDTLHWVRYLGNQA